MPFPDTCQPLSRQNFCPHSIQRRARKLPNHIPHSLQTNKKTILWLPHVTHHDGTYIDQDTTRYVAQSYYNELINRLITKHILGWAERNLSELTPHLSKLPQDGIQRKLLTHHAPIWTQMLYHNPKNTPKISSTTSSTAKMISGFSWVLA